MTNQLGYGKWDELRDEVRSWKRKLELMEAMEAMVPQYSCEWAC